jgi:hypothetical protein
MRMVSLVAGRTFAADVDVVAGSGRIVRPSLKFRCRCCRRRWCCLRTLRCPRPCLAPGSVEFERDAADGCVVVGGGVTRESVRAEGRSWRAAGSRLGLRLPLALLAIASSDAKTSDFGFVLPRSEVSGLTADV